MAQIRLIIADDMLPIREFLRMSLDREADITVVDAVGTGADAVDRALAARPDVLLMDLEMGTPVGTLDAIKTVMALAPGIRVVVSSLFSDDEKIVKAFEVGASGYILKNASTEKIAATIRTISNSRPNAIKPSMHLVF